MFRLSISFMTIEISGETASVVHVQCPSLIGHTMSSKVLWHNVALSLGSRHCLHLARSLRTQPRDPSGQLNNHDAERPYHPGNTGLATPREVYPVEILDLVHPLKYLSSFNT